MKPSPAVLRRPTIVASIPGRMRLRDDAFARDTAAEAVAGRLGALPGCRTVRANPAASSIVVEYDAGVRDEPAMRRAVLQALGPAAPETADSAPVDAGPLARPAAAGRSASQTATETATAAVPVAAPDGPAPTLPRRRRVSRKRLVARYAKYAMMASLGGSLVAAAAGAKAAHIALGGVFLGFAGVHVVGYRRTLLR